MSQAEYTQDEPNHVWYTSEKLSCCHCGRKPDTVIEVKDAGMFCFMGGRSECFEVAMAQGDPIYVRMVVRRRVKKGIPRPRDPVGLAKRYFVLKRDGFQCVACGASGQESKLEIDHRLPVSKGGGNSIENLQTLCFDCNRGKGAS